MGLFTRKATPVLTEVPNPWGIGAITVDEQGRPQGDLLIGSLNGDGDAETDVVGESAFRDDLLFLLETAEDYELAAGRVEQVFDLMPDGDRVVVLSGRDRVGFLRDEDAAVWAPRLRDWLAHGATSVACSGVVLWPQSKGDPREDDSIPVGVRLDLVDQR